MSRMRGAMSKDCGFGRDSVPKQCLWIQCAHAADMLTIHTLLVLIVHLNPACQPEPGRSQVGLTLIECWW